MILTATQAADIELAANAIWRLFRHDFDPDGDDIQRYLYKELVLILSQVGRSTCPLPRQQATENDI